MKKSVSFLFGFLFLGVFFSSILFAGQKTDIRKWIVGKPDPRGEVTIVTNPMNQFINQTFHPEPPPQGEEALYEEVVPVEGIPYPKEEAPLEGSPSPENSFKEEGGYYESDGLYYPPPSEKK